MTEVTGDDVRLAARIYAEARDWDMLPHELERMLAEYRESCEERARKELAYKVRAALCHRCRAGVRLVQLSPPGYHSWLHVNEYDRAVGYCTAPYKLPDIHAILGTPTGGPDADK